MTFDRADEIIEMLGGMLEELQARPVDPRRIFRISDQLTIIESELAIRPEPGQPLKA